MAPFDGKAYEEAVVKPLRRRSAGDLPDDLVSRYAVDLGMSDGDVARRLAEVRSHWNKNAQAQAKPQGVRGVYKAFLRADEVLKGEHGDRLARIDWWREHAKSRVGAREGQVGDLTDTLRAGFGALGLIATSQLQALLGTGFTSLAPDEVERALTAAGVKASSPVELPKASGLPDTQYRELERNLVDADTDSVPALLHGPLTSFTLLTSFSCKPPQPNGLTPQAVAAAVDRENRRSGNQSARQALGILSSAAKEQTDLRRLALFHLLRDVRVKHREGVPVIALLKRLVATGLERDEARQAVFSVLTESAPAAVTGLTAVKEMLTEGRLVAAQQALATIAGSEDAAAARQLVDAQLAEVRRLRQNAHTALRSGAEDDALHHFRQAVALAVDDEELVAEVRRVPPAPVLGISASPDGVGVRVSWRAAASHDEAIRFRLVRREGRAPVDPDDGELVAETAESVAVDRKAPAGHQVGYAVFAGVPAGAWSRAVDTTIEVLPPVHGVLLSVEDGEVSGRWQAHPEVLSVEVRRDDGVVVATSGRTAFRDRSAGDGERAYTVTASYRRADGSTAKAAGVIARTTSRARMLPVTSLSLTPVRADGAARIAISWRQHPEAEIAVRRSAALCDWSFGDVVTSADLGGYGDEVTGAVEDQGEWRTLTADVPTGQFWYVPFTVGDSGAVRGQEAALGIALPLTGLRFQRLGDECVVSWVWPEAVGTAAVSWSTPERSDELRLTKQQYLTGGGCRIRSGPGELRVSVRGVVSAAHGECVSAAGELVVPDRLPKVRYTVQLARKPLLGGGTVRVRLTADAASTRCTVLVVAAQGQVMPRRPGDGRVVLRSAQDLGPDAEVELSAELPRLRKPYWIRCFLEEEGAAVLVDPPTKQLKVS